MNITLWLIILNVAVYFFALFLGMYSNPECSETICKYLAIQPNAILHLQNLWTILTSIFTHGNFTHLLVNMISLMFIGSFVERLIGRKRYITFFLVSGILAGLFFVLISYITQTDLNVYAVGASGALFALGGLLAVLTPKLKVLVFFIIPMPMWIAMIFLLGVLWVVSLIGAPIGNLAHLGGLLAGLAYGFYLRMKYPNKIRKLSMMFR